MSKRQQNCPHCHGPRSYNEKHDLYACLGCDVWLEKVHTPDDCEDCPFPYAPSKPSEVTP